MSIDGVGVIVLTYGGGGIHAALFDSLAAEGVAPEQVLAVHNPALDGEPDPGLPPGCALVRADRNLGYAGGMNLGIEAWRSRPGPGPELLLLLTHDARLRPGAPAALAAAARANPRAGVLGPVMFETGTEVPFSFGGRTGPGGATSHLKSAPEAAEGGIAPCDWVDGGTMLMRSELIDRVGAFDSRFFAYCEESDLCLRVRRAGFVVGVVLDAHADQDSGAARRPGAWAYLMTRNGIAYSRRAAGVRGLLGGLWRALRQASLQAVRTLLRVVRLRPGDPAETWPLAVGCARGAIDYLRGRWGPPPAGLPGAGDVTNA